MRIGDASLAALLIETRDISSRPVFADPFDVWTFDHWRDVEHRCREVLETDPHLELAIWLAEAWTLFHELDGLADGLRLVTRLLEESWDQLVPEVDEFHLEEVRVAQLLRLDACLSRALLSVRIGWRGTFTLRNYLELRLLERLSDDDRQEYARFFESDLRALTEGWVEAARVDRWQATYALERLRELAHAADAYTRVASWRIDGYWWQGSDALDLTRTRATMRRLERALGEATVEAESGPAAKQDDQSSIAHLSASSPLSGVGESVTVPQPANREDAVRQLAEVTLYVCGDDPDGLACLMLERSLRLAASSRDEWLAELQRIGRRGKPT